MDSIRNAFEIDRVVGSPTTEGSFTLKLTGLRVERDPRGPYKPSRVLGLTVDDIDRSVSFPSRERTSPWTWEIESESAVPITTESTIMIQPYAARRFRRKKKTKRITITGDLVFRLFLANAKPGDRYDYEHVGAGFKMFLSFVAQGDNQATVMNRSDPGRQTDLLERNDQEVSHDPCMTSDSIQLCLRSLRDLMQSLPPSASETGENAMDTLQKACKLASTGNLDEDVGHLCERVYNLLGYMQGPMFYGNLVSLTQTVKSTLNLVTCAAMFLEDYFKPKLNDLANPAFRKPILDEFGRQLMIMKSSFDIGKDVSVRKLPYTRKPTPSTTVSFFSGFSPRIDSKFETTNQGRDVGTEETDLDRLRQALHPESVQNPLGLACLGRTRIDLLSSITAWFDDNSAPNILWLCGAPGTGKTTISWSLIEVLKQQQRCASFFFFRPRKHTPSKLWRTLAYEMARFHPAIESEIHSVLTNGTNDKFDLNDVEVTFSKLVSGPLKMTNSLLSGRNPVFLIDALDQCRRSQDNSWETFLNTLSQWSSLPRHCKLIITSRPQSDIAKAFEGEVKRVELLTGDSVDDKTREDVRAYLDYRFAEMRRQNKSIPDRWPNNDAISKLVDHTKGSFKWAAVAVDSIQAAGEKEKQLTVITEGGTTIKLDLFDKYLEEVLKTAFEGNSSDGFERNSPETYEGSSSDASKGHSSDVFREAMGVIALSKQSLTMADLKYFLQDHFTSAPGVSIEDVCYRLLSIISIEGESREIKFRHNAYKDYLIDSKRCTLFDDAFHRNVHRKMAILCLKIMQQELKFNICGLKSSYRMNSQVEVKESLIKKCISSHLAYACQYWADHLHGITAVEKRDTEIIYLLRNFLNTQLLYWLEVLSMLSKSHVAPKSLLVAAEWLELSSVEMLSFRRYYLRIVAKDLSFMAADASRFSLTFADVISASAPHIYLSALPFAPPTSLVSKQYRGQFPQTIKVLHGEGVKWPAMRYSISTGDCVYDISIHPDGRRVAAAMRSGSAIVFSMTTGEFLFPLLGHKGSVRTIAYGPSSKRIATGCDSGRLRIYEAENGSLLFGPFNLHPDRIRSVAWSPDGQRIVTGSDDRKVKVVLAETGHVIYDMAFHDDWVRTVLYTNDFFISGSDDKTVRIYNASTGTASGEAWSTGQTDYVRAIAISPNGKILAAGSDDHSIILYDMDDRRTIRKPIRGHNKAIRCLVFSRDGQQLASCSDDQTVRLWNVSTGKKSCDPLHGNTSFVSSVKFSPDMKQLVTGGEDGSIRLFDMDSLPIQNHSGDTGVFRAANLLDDGNIVLASDGSSISRWSVDKGHIKNVPFEGDSEHLTKIQSVSISPDGQLVATVAGNRTIVIWKAESGKISCGPIEGHADYIRGLGFSPDSTMVVSGSDDQKVNIWSVETGKSIHGPMGGHEAGVGEVCFSPDGKQVASGSYDNTAMLWSVESGEKVHEPLKCHHDWICGLAYSPNGQYLATASDDHTVAIWDVTTGTRQSHVLTGHRGFVRIVNWSPDSKWIVTGARDNTIRVFDVKTGSLVCKPLMGHTSIPTMLTFHSSSFHHDVEVVSASLDGTIRVWDLGTKSFAETKTFPKRHRDWILSVAISPVQNRIASGGDDGRLFVTDSVTGDAKFSCDAHKCWIRCVTYSPDGAKIATCADDSTIGIWDANDGSCLLDPFNCDVGVVFSIAFSPDGKVLISGNNDATVRSWALHAPIIGKLNHLSTYVGHTGPVRTVAYARMGDSERIVSGSDDAEIAIWDGDSDRLIRKFGGHEAAILSISVSGDKVFSSSKDKTIRVWDLDTGDNISIIRGHTAPINQIKLLPDERWIVSASDDGSLRIWDSKTGKPLTLPRSMPFRILSVDISCDGNLIVCSGANGQVHTWSPDMAEPAVWPDSFMRRMHGREYCPIDDEGILMDATLRNDGWLCGPMGQIMCWIPPTHRQGLLQRAVSVVGAQETALDLRNFAHGTKWDQCATNLVTESEGRML